MEKLENAVQELNEFIEAILPKGYFEREIQHQLYRRNGTFVCCYIFCLYLKHYNLPHIHSHLSQIFLVPFFYIE